MKKTEFKAIAAKGEDSRLQFKQDVHNVDALAAEMVAFSNSEGGRILIGVTDTGELVGILRSEVSRINQLISNAASQHVRSPISPLTENVAVGKSRIVIVVTVPKGIDKPYFDHNGIIWLKSGSDKRRINSKEELRRLFQMSDQFHADELPTQAKLEALDKLRFRDFLKAYYERDFPESSDELARLLQNMSLATDDGRLNLAGVLLFAERPEWIVPQFIVKAVRYPGNEIHGTAYLDSEDFTGPLRKVFDDSLAFVLRNLHKVQAGRGVNAPGVENKKNRLYNGLSSIFFKIACITMFFSLIENYRKHVGIFRSEKGLSWVYIESCSNEMPVGSQHVFNTQFPH